MSDRHAQGSDLPPFIIVPKPVFDYMEAGKISDRAFALYTVLLSYHNRTRGDDYVWPTRKTLATKLGLKKPDAVDKPLKELQDAGLILSEQRRSSDGGQTSSKHKLLLTANSKTPTPDLGYPYPKSGVGVPQNEEGGYPESGVGATPNQGYELEELELDEVEALKNLSSQALAPLDASDNVQGDEELNDSSKKWMEEYDRSRFWSLIDEDLLFIAGDEEQMKKMESYSLNVFYDWLRDEGIEYPGEYLAANSSDAAGGVDGWLVSQGLCRYEWMADEVPATVTDWFAAAGAEEQAEWAEARELAAQYAVAA
jgi:hypothetical protein